MEQKALAVKEDRTVTYQAADGQEVRLTPDIIKKYLVQGKGELVTTQELMYFLNICKARKMNPLVKDCYLVKYSENEAAAIITSVDFFRKRARAQGDCKGWRKGVIVKTKDGQVRDTHGLVLEDEKLVGGWFEAQPDGWIQPFRLEVNLSGYVKKTKEGKITKFWNEENQPTMISKIAEAQGLRSLWPDEFQQIYSEDEISPGGGVNTGASVIDIEGEATAANFDSLIPENIDRAALEKYLAVCVGHFKKPVETIKSEAAKDMTAFLDQFIKWAVRVEKNRQAKGKEKATAEQTPGATAAVMSTPCPNDSKRYPKSHCNQCFERNGCPSWSGPEKATDEAEPRFKCAADTTKFATKAICAECQDRSGCQGGVKP
jgi:phage recombination protein Bet